MVFLSRLLRLPVKLKDGGTLYEDAARIYVRGGDGGRGLPDYGGVGGDGGNVHLQADKKMTLNKLNRQNKNKRFIAGNGQHSSRIFILGEKGKDSVVKVPAGITVCTDDDRELCSLNQIGERVIVAKGGEGGSPKTDYIGQDAIPHMIRLYLKLIADVSLVGFPNAGKSTMLKALSNAKPRISSYPFTTLRPQVGILDYDDLRKISMADLPGLIDGSYSNVGLGHRFLRHVERTSMMVVMVDVNGFKLDDESPYRTAFETLVLLNKELELCNESVIDKPAILCVNKMDGVGADRKLRIFLDKLEKIDEHLYEFNEAQRPTKLFRFMDTVPVCARDFNSEPMKRLKTRIREILDELDDLKRKDGEDDGLGVERHSRSLV